MGARCSAAWWRTLVLMPKCRVEPVIASAPSLSERAMALATEQGPTVLSTILVAIFIVKAFRIWIEAPRRRDGQTYGTLARDLPWTPERPSECKSTEHLKDDSPYKLSRPRSVTRLQMMRMQEDEALFSHLASLMKQVASLFTVKAVINALLTMHTAHMEGISALPAFFDSADELTFAFLIRSASAGFEEMASSPVLEQIGDVSSMLDALHRLRELWTQMRLPLLVQSLIKSVQLGMRMIG